MYMQSSKSRVIVTYLGTYPLQFEEREKLQFTTLVQMLQSDKTYELETVEFQVNLFRQGFIRDSSSQ